MLTSKGSQVSRVTSRGHMSLVLTETLPSTVRPPEKKSQAGREHPLDGKDGEGKKYFRSLTFIQMT